MKQGWLLLLFIVSCFQLYGQQKIEVKAEFDTTQIRIGEQAQLKLTAKFPSGKKLQFPILKDTLVKNVEIVSAQKPDTVFDENDLKIQTIEQSYLVTSFDSGYYAIRPFQFVLEKDTFETQPFLFEVTTVSVDTTQAFKDIKAPIEVEYTFMDWLKDNYRWILLGIAIIIAVLGIVWYLRKKAKEPKIEKKEPVVLIPPHIEALQKLKELDEKKIWQSGEIKQYYSELTEILNDYFEKRYRVSLAEKTTDEVMQTLRLKPLQQAVRDDLYGLLKLADLVKFAKEKPVGFENEQSMKIAVQLVESTKGEEINHSKLEEK